MFLCENEILCWKFFFRCFHIFYYVIKKILSLMNIKFMWKSIALIEFSFWDIWNFFFIREEILYLRKNFLRKERKLFFCEKMDPRVPKLIYYILFFTHLLVILLLSIINNEVTNASKYFMLSFIVKVINIFSAISLFISITIGCIFYYNYVTKLKEGKKQLIINILLIFITFITIILIPITFQLLRPFIKQSENFWISVLLKFAGIIVALMFVGSICLCVTSFISTCFSCYKFRFLHKPEVPKPKPRPTPAKRYSLQGTYQNRPQIIIFETP